MNTIVIYERQDGRLPFKQWINSLRDKTIVARIHARLARVIAGNFGDSKSVGHGVFELRLAFGSAYRIYYGIDNNTLVILLMGGDKSTQERDIKNAYVFWNDYLARTKL